MIYLTNITKINLQKSFTGPPNPITRGKPQQPKRANRSSQICRPPSRTFFLHAPIPSQEHHGEWQHLPTDAEAPGAIGLGVEGGWQSYTDGGGRVTGAVVHAGVERSGAG